MSEGKKTEKSVRKARLAAALKGNIGKRKAQAKARKAPEPPPKQ
jgi:hypothetical protein